MIGDAIVPTIDIARAIHAAVALQSIGVMIGFLFSLCTRLWREPVQGVYHKMEGMTIKATRINIHEKLLQYTVGTTFPKRELSFCHRKYSVRREVKGRWEP